MELKSNSNCKKKGLLKMSFAKKLNAKRNRQLDIDTTDFTYIKLADLYKENGPETVYTVLGCYQHDGQFGRESVAIIANHFVNLPHHLNDDIAEIMQNMDIIENKQLGFKVIPYTSKYGNFYTVQWIDL